MYLQGNPPSLLEQLPNTCSHDRTQTHDLGHLSFSQEQKS